MLEEEDEYIKLKSRDNSVFYLACHIHEYVSGKITSAKVKKNLDEWKIIKERVQDILEKEMKISIECWINCMKLFEDRHSFSHTTENITKDEALTLVTEKEYDMLCNYTSTC